MKKKAFYQYQTDITLKNLDLENRRLREKIKQIEEGALQSRNILEFHDALEKDFFSAESLEDLIMKLINCLQLRPNIDFVTLCLTREYLETMLGSHFLDRFLPKIGIPEGMGYLQIVEKEDLEKHLPSSPGTPVKPPRRSSRDVFFPDHGGEVRSRVIIPLHQHHLVIGTLNIGSILSKHFYSAETGSDLLGRLSAKLAIAIDNILAHKKLALQKNILDQDINRAALLQKSLLPPSPLVTDLFQLSCQFHPCHKLGGDFYDWFPLQEGRLGIIIADVSGHGITAALIAAMLKFSLLGDHLTTLSAGAAVSEINRRFTELLQHGDYITLCYGVLDAAQAKIDLVRAGHPYPMLYRAHEEHGTPLKPSGPPVGLNGAAAYETLEITLEPGDALLFYTDGLTEILDKNTDPEEGGDPLRFLGKKQETQGLLGRLTSEMAAAEGMQELEDDVTYVLLSMK